jgi:hypothetical protein
MLVRLCYQWQWYTNEGMQFKAVFPYEILLSGCDWAKIASG